MPVPPQFQAKPRKGSKPVANNGAAAIALGNALLDALARLAEVYGGAGQWLDEIEARAIKSAKNLAVEHIDMRDEADAVQFGVDTVKAAFAMTRERIEKAVAQRSNPQGPNKQGSGDE